MAWIIFHCLHFFCEFIELWKHFLKVMCNISNFILHSSCESSLKCLQTPCYIFLKRIFTRKFTWARWKCLHKSHPKCKHRNPFYFSHHPSWLPLISSSMSLDFSFSPSFLPRAGFLPLRSPSWYLPLPHSLFSSSVLSLGLLVFSVSYTYDKDFFDAQCLRTSLN